VAPDDYAEVHHFVCASCWPPEPLERVLATKAQALVGGPDAVLIVDDTAFLTQGKRSREAAWLVGEWRDSGERKFYLTNHPERTPVHALAAAVKARWVCEQAHQQLKEELGLDHFEGRTWTGLHHHALLSLISFAFVQPLRTAFRSPPQPG
jgi:SRSO17 transposase